MGRKGKTDNGAGEAAVIDTEAPTDVDESGAPTEHRVIIERHVKVELTDQEFHDAAKEMAEAFSRCRELNLERKGWLESWKARYEEEESKLISSQRLVNDGFTIQERECERLLDFATNRVVITRLDTGEVVEEREMTHHERQAEFFA